METPDIVERLAGRVQHELNALARLDPRRPLLVGVSGGADSACLLHLLARLGWSVTAAHFDHQLRAGSGGEGARVAEMAARLGAGFIGGGGDVAGLAARERLSIEEAARTARYRFLLAAARQVGAQAVGVGHTADDQAETVLMHLLRGAGLAGLRGMSVYSLPEGWEEPLGLLRPLLGVWRAEIDACCAALGIEPLVDGSNADPAFFRNRLRHELIPVLETYNPQFRQVLLRTADVLRGEYKIVAEAVEAAWERCCTASGAGYIGFERGSLAELSAGLLRGVLRRAVGQLRPGLRDIGFDDIERGAAFVLKPSRSAEMDLTAGLRLFVEEGQVFLEEPGRTPLGSGWPQLEGGQPAWLDLPGSVALANGWRLRAERVEAGLVDIRAARPGEIWLDARGLSFPLLVRPAWPGERLMPLGMGGHSQKLSDLWINAGVPRRARACWPLVCAGDEALWAVGLRAGNSHQAREPLRELIHICLEKA